MGISPIWVTAERRSPQALGSDEGDKHDPFLIAPPLSLLIPLKGVRYVAALVGDTASEILKGPSGTSLPAVPL